MKNVKFVVVEYLQDWSIDFDILRVRHPISIFYSCQQTFLVLVPIAKSAQTQKNFTPVYTFVCCVLRGRTARGSCQRQPS